MVGECYVAAACAVVVAFCHGTFECGSKVGMDADGLVCVESVCVV